MHKECPHCHEDTFGWRELITLNCFSSDQCKNCHKLVRNSGWRQVLGPLAFVAILLVTIPLWRDIPGEASALLIPLAAFVLAVALVMAAKPVKTEVPLTDRASFTPNPENDKVILIQGWNEDEISQILNDFLEADATAFVAFRIEMEKRLENSFALNFPEDIHPAEFLSLIGYLAYPNNFDTTGRAIIVAGKTTLNSDFDGLVRSLEGTRAVLYIPENDDDHDVLYLRTDSGVTLAKSSHEGAWRKVKDSRLSSAVESLTW
jgi:hypothetical protein